MGTPFPFPAQNAYSVSKFSGGRYPPPEPSRSASPPVLGPRHQFPIYRRVGVGDWHNRRSVDLSDTILPPPELFDTADVADWCLLPPPAEFDGVSRASSTVDLPLPPPPAFFDDDDDYEVMYTNRQCSRFSSK